MGAARSKSSGNRASAIGVFSCDCRRPKPDCRGSERERQLQVPGVHHVAMLEQDGVEGGLQRRVPRLECRPARGVHLALLGGQRGEHGHECRAVDVQRRLIASSRLTYSNIVALPRAAPLRERSADRCAACRHEQTKPRTAKDAQLRRPATARSGERLNLVQAEIARHNGDGDRKLPGGGAGAKHGHEGPRAGALLGRPQHQDGHVLVVLDLLQDGVDQLAFADHFFDRNLVAASIAELAAEQAKQGARLVGLLVELHLAHGVPELVLGLDHE